MATKWGIAGAGLICHDYVTAMATIPSGEHQVVAVAASDEKRAKDFAALHKIPTAYGSYMDLARNPEIDIVYIGVISIAHYEVAKMMLENGKHVLCEKALTLSERDTKHLCQIAKEKGLFLMEAIWSRCFPAYDYIRSEIAAGSIGDIVHVQANFGIVPGARAFKRELGGGTTVDLGVYTLQLAVMLFGTEMPDSLQAVGQLNEDGVDVGVVAAMAYPPNKTVSLTTSFLTTMDNEAVIYGTKGCIRIPSPFHCPTEVTVLGKTKEFNLPPGAHPYNLVNSSGLRFEAMEVRRCLKEGLLESPKMTHAESIAIAMLQDAIRAQLGVRYPFDY